MKRERSALGLLLSLAGAIVLVHLLFGGRYGFHRDELATLDDARHLAWGYVAYPPVTPFFGWISLHLFGTSLTGFRFFASLASAIAILVTGWLARDLGGGRVAQMLAACAAAPFVLAIGTLMQYVSFDYLAWVAVAYFIARLCRSGDPRWWLAIGAAIGFGMLSKYSMPFLVAGVGVGLLLSDSRRQLRSKWLWLGALVAILIFLPNLLWQWQHDFVSLEFLRNIHARDVRLGRTRTFLADQIGIAFFALPLACAGLIYYFVHENARRFRILGWMFVVPLAIFIVAKGRGYYLAPAYPMLYAAGAVWTESGLARLRRHQRVPLTVFCFGALIAGMALLSAFFLPIAPVNSAWWQRMVKVNGDLREEIGWPELAELVARLRDQLPPDERVQVQILAGNYGEAGALNLYGPHYGLPPVICPINSFWERGYGNPPPEILIVLGSSREQLVKNFQSCELIGHITNREGVPNEETTEHPDIFLCRHLRRNWPELWSVARKFG